MLVRYNGKDMKIKGTLYKYKCGPGKRATIKEYQREEQSVLEVTHINICESTGELVYWLKSYGLTSWSIHEKVPR